CASTFIGKFAAKAYRRPLAAGELESLVALYANGKSEGFAAGIEMVVAAVLQDPSFLYRVEAGVPNSVKDHPELRRLTGTEVAQRLSYSLWGTLPDDALTMAAQSGGLDTPAGIQQGVSLAKSNRTFPIGRARFIRERLACEDLPPPIADATNLPSVKGLIDAQNARYGGAQNVPPRAFYQEITSQDTTCKACH